MKIRGRLEVFGTIERSCFILNGGFSTFILPYELPGKCENLTAFEKKGMTKIPGKPEVLGVIKKEVVFIFSFNGGNAKLI